MTTVVFNFDKLRNQLANRTGVGKQSSVAIRRALTRVGALIANEMRIQYRKSGLKRQTGRLANSLDYRIVADGKNTILEVGSFGVPYAAVHEFGGNNRVPAHSRMITQAFGKPIEPRSVQVRAHTRTVPARPFVGPAVRRQAANIAEILKEELNR